MRFSGVRHCWTACALATARGEGRCLTLWPPGSADAGGGKKLSRRIVANRESAQRSRLRKLQYIADLEANIAGLNGQVRSHPCSAA